MSGNLRIAGGYFFWVYTFCCGLLIGVGFQSQSLTLEEVISLIRNVTSPEINCKAGNSNRLIDNIVNISLNKLQKGVCHISLKSCVHLLIWQQAFFSGANLYIFSSQELWVGVLPDFNNLVISLLADNEAIWIFFCKYLSGRVSFIFLCAKMFEDKLSSIVSYAVINMLLVDLPKFSRKSMITSCLPVCPLTSNNCLHMSDRILHGKWQFVPKNSKNHSAV